MYNKTSCWNVQQTWLLHWDSSCIPHFEIVSTQVLIMSPRTGIAYLKADALCLLDKASKRMGLRYVGLNNTPWCRLPSRVYFTSVRAYWRLTTCCIQGVLCVPLLFYHRILWILVHTLKDWERRNETRAKQCLYKLRCTPSTCSGRYLSPWIASRHKLTDVETTWWKEDISNRLKIIVLADLLAFVPTKSDQLHLRSFAKGNRQV